MLAVGGFLAFPLDTGWPVEGRNIGTHTCRHRCHWSWRGHRCRRHNGRRMFRATLFHHPHRGCPGLGLAQLARCRRGGSSPPAGQDGSRCSGHGGRCSTRSRGSRGGHYRHFGRGRRHSRGRQHGLCCGGGCSGDKRWSCHHRIGHRRGGGSASGTPTLRSPPPGDTTDHQGHTGQHGPAHQCRGPARPGGG